MSRNQIGSEPVTSDSQQTSTDRPTLLSKCLKKKKLLWIVIFIIIVILVVTITTVIIKTKKTNKIKLSTVATETTDETAHEFTITVDNPTTQVQNKPKYNKWNEYGITIAGGNGHGDHLNQLLNPDGIYIDDNKAILITDNTNNRIVEWKYNAMEGEVIAGGHGAGHSQNQLYFPADVIVDKEKNAIIICDFMNGRVMRWFRQSQTNPEILISNIQCKGLAIDKDRSIYVSDFVRCEVTRWKEGDTVGTVVAGGNDNGDGLNQFSWPMKIFVDKDYSVYVSDWGNHRIMKWEKDAKEGIVVAGGNERGDDLNQLNYPDGLIVDTLGQIYIADSYNYRVMLWFEGDTNGSIVVGGNGRGDESNQLANPTDLSFDVEGSLYVSDGSNHRIQKYEQCTE
ncbi:unnamed protein product [Adineta steineri]|uniref:NHL repeat containing protein-like protein n=1 Tax=Adineta steineri TaxID=433720 RepID=A0A813PVX5_9BILA|nr:unnamed protein product [Adineta steineri]